MSTSNKDYDDDDDDDDDGVDTARVVLVKLLLNLTIVSAALESPTMLTSAVCSVVFDSLLLPSAI